MTASKDKVCSMCGGVGNTKDIATCCQCKRTALHKYCMLKPLKDFPKKWRCDSCEGSRGSVSVSYTRRKPVESGCSNVSNVTKARTPVKRSSPLKYKANCDDISAIGKQHTSTQDASCAQDCTSKMSDLAKSGAKSRASCKKQNLSVLLSQTNTESVIQPSISGRIVTAGLNEGLYHLKVGADNAQVQASEGIVNEMENIQNVSGEEAYGVPCKKGPVDKSFGSGMPSEAKCNFVTLQVPNHEERERVTTVLKKEGYTIPVKEEPVDVSNDDRVYDHPSNFGAQQLPNDKDMKEVKMKSLGMRLIALGMRLTASEDIVNDTENIQNVSEKEGYTIAVKEEPVEVSNNARVYDHPSIFVAQQLPNDRDMKEVKMKAVEKDYSTPIKEEIVPRGQDASSANLPDDGFGELHHEATDKHLSSCGPGNICSIAQIKKCGFQKADPPLPMLLVSHDQHLSEVVWKGDFEVFDAFSHVYNGIQAHVPSNISPKAYDILKQLPHIIKFKLLPRLDVWPQGFQLDPPSINDIGLYFSPCELHRCKETYNLLLEEIDQSDLAIQSCIGDVELLAFTSKLLSRESRVTGLPVQEYLWGVFRCLKRKKRYLHDRDQFFVNPIIDGRREKISYCHRSMSSSSIPHAPPGFSRRYSASRNGSSSRVETSRAGSVRHYEKSKSHGADRKNW